MAGTGDVIALGFGPWSDIDVVPTFGFGVGEVSDTVMLDPSGDSRRVSIPLLDSRRAVHFGPDDYRVSK